MSNSAPPNAADGRTEGKLDPSTLQRERRRAFVGANAGHAIEFYDYGIYGYLAAFVASSFFPSTDPVAALLASFAVFALSFFIRPLGGLIFGPIADKVGRKKTLLTVLVLMSGSTFVIGLLPTYEQVGILAPLLLIVVRVIQGLSAGGEVGAAISFVVEYAGPKRRGYSASWLMFSATIGFVTGAAVANGLAAALGNEAMADWGWRIPFLLAGPLGLVAIYVRMKLEDSPVFRALEKSGEVAKNPLRAALREPRIIFLTFSLLVMHAASYYLLSSYLGTYLRAVMHFDPGTVLWVSVGSLVLAGLLMPLSGYLSDVFDRRNLLLGVALAGCITLPAFFLFSPGASTPLFILLLVAVAATVGFFSSSITGMVVALIPARVRATILAVSWNAPIALFGGTAPLVTAWLTQATGDITAPAWYFLGTALVSTVALLLIKRSDYI